jgi:MoxR-like ATPase
MATVNVREKVRAIQEELQGKFADRDEVIHGCLIALLSGKHILMLGPPGVGKSLMARSICGSITGANYFERLLTKFSGPEELFGPTSAKGLMEDRFERVIEGSLATADIALIDEVFKANPPILNSLLTIINEGLFHNGTKPIMCPLKTLIGASNEIPEEDDGLEAFDDRLQIRFMVKKLTNREDMQAMLTAPNFHSETKISKSELEKAKKEVSAVDFGEDSLKVYLDLWSLCNNKGFDITDRVYRQSMDILRAEAWFNGHENVTEEDFEILRHVFWKRPEKMREVHLEILNATNPQKSRITEIYQECMRISQEVLKKDDTAAAFDAIKKIKNKVKEVEKLVTEMRNLKKDTNEAVKMMGQMRKTMEQIGREGVSMVFDV